ncbi:MAG TPA: GTP-dependent dephospho-CoA kinase family protein [Methanocella sp.]|nr:GTP-dependent dephospho-CoA kinase family protein [Methanocella sp.]
MIYKLTPAMREKLKIPFGTLYRGKGESCLAKVVKILNRPPKIISIGDMTTYYLIKAGVVPDMCLVDDQTMRLPVDLEVHKGTSHHTFKELRVSNPAGVVTPALMDMVRDNMDSKVPVRIFVEGEEDLAVIPACLYAPIGSAVIYGQPSEGVVVVMVTVEKRNETLALLNQMEKE